MTNSSLKTGGPLSSAYRSADEDELLSASTTLLGGDHSWGGTSRLTA